jgi:hypothetical protein
MIELTDQQQQEVKNGQPLRIKLVEFDKPVVLLLEEEYEKLVHEDEEDRKVQEGWQKLVYRGLAMEMDKEPRDDGKEPSFL